MRPMSLILIVAVICGLSSFVEAAVPASSLDRKVSGKLAYNVGREVDVPQHAETKPYLTLVVHDDWRNRQRDLQLVQWFEQHPRLRKIRSLCYWDFTTQSDPGYRSSLHHAMGDGAPGVCLQYGGRANQPPLGKIALKATAGFAGAPGLLPGNPDELADALWSALDVMFAAPQFAGQQTFTPIIDDPTAEQCPGPDCRPRPVQPLPNVQPSIPDVMPVSPAGKTVVWLVGSLAMIGVGYVVIQRLNRPQPAAF